MSSVLSSLQGVRLVGRGTTAFVASSRGLKSINGQGTCLAAVYLDRVMMYGRPGDPPFDVNSIVPDDVEAIEYYSGPAVTPLEYSTLNSRCGVLVIWTRQ